LPDILGPVSAKCKFYISIVFISIFYIQGISFSQQPDYRIIFGSNWEKADAFVSENEYWLKSACEKNNISFTFAVAIVFPELIRYSALKDKIEISLLKTLYINLGEDYADFSVGPFQMKPSFGEDIHKRVQSVRERRIRNLFKTGTSYKDVREYRKSIVADLEDPRSELNYLIAFIKICEHNYMIKWKDENEKLKFFSTAYNCGLDKGQDYIYAMSEKKFFSTSIVKTKTYSYSDISVYWNILNSKSGKH
jgi:hypothetical protein